MRQHFTILCVVVVALAGCGSEYQIAPVSGKITLDGEPLDGALVNFEPVRQGDSLEAGYGSNAECDANGAFSLKSLHGEDGAIVGPHRVLITTFKAKEGPNGETLIWSQEKVPQRYMDYDKPLTFEVPADGTSEANFDLTTLPGKN
jgi:hypothetical protein